MKPQPDQPVQPEQADLDGLDLDEIVRKSEGKKYFGLSPTQLEVAIEANQIPRPFYLVEGGRAQGWTGRMIKEHHRKRIAAAERDKAQHINKRVQSLA